MTMNTRQAGAFTELIKKEEKAREQWNATHGVAYAARAAQAAQARARADALGVVAQGNGFGGLPLSATQMQQTQQQQQQSPYAYTNGNGPASARSGSGYSSASPRGLGSSRSGSATARVETHMVPRLVRSVGVVEEDALTEREELYEELVPVVRTRRVSVPVKRLREVDRWVEVLAPEQRVVDDGVGANAGANANANGNGPASFRSTNGSANGGQGPQSARYSYGFSPYDLPTGQQTQTQRPLSARSNASNGYGYGYSAPQQQQQPYMGMTQTGSQRLGFKVRASSTLPGTCVVVEVEAAASAGRAGLRPGDILISTNGQRVANLQDVKNAIGNSRGPILLQVKRGADRFVVTLQR